MRLMIKSSTDYWHAAGVLVPVALETFGAIAMGTQGDANLREVARNYAWPVTWLDAHVRAPADKGPNWPLSYRSRYRCMRSRLQLYMWLMISRLDREGDRELCSACMHAAMAPWH